MPSHKNHWSYNKCIFHKMWENQHKAEDVAAEPQVSVTERRRAMLSNVHQTVHNATLSESLRILVTIYKIPMAFKDSFSEIH